VAVVAVESVKVRGHVRGHGAQGETRRHIGARQAGLVAGGSGRSSIGGERRRHLGQTQHPRREVRGRPASLKFQRFVQHFGPKFIQLHALFRIFYSSLFKLWMLLMNLAVTEYENSLN